MTTPYPVNELTIGVKKKKKQNDRRRRLQGGAPRYTSPPTDVALESTPVAFRSDQVINDARDMAAAGICSPLEESTYCHIPFEPPVGVFDISRVGVIFFVGAFVDPRGYSPLAKLVAERYGIPVVIPIFEEDISLTIGNCESGRLPMAQAQHPDIKRWILTGHGLGGLAATAEAWTALIDTSSTIDDFDEDAATIGGLVLLAADIQNVGCGPTNFANTSFPMALSSATNDDILNQTRYEENIVKTSNATFFVEIFGGNHGQYGSYDDNGRVAALGPSQMDGTPTIPPQVQWDISASALFHVASRSGVSLPQRLPVTESPTSFPTFHASKSPTRPPTLDASKPPTGLPAMTATTTPTQSTTTPTSSSLPSQSASARPTPVPITPPPVNGPTNPPTLICPESPNASVASLSSSQSLYSSWILLLPTLILYGRFR